MAVRGSRIELIVMALIQRRSFTQNISSYPLFLWSKQEDDSIIVIDDTVSKLFEAGIISKWLKDKQKSFDKRFKYSIPIQLTMGHFLFAIYFVYVRCTFACCLVLYLEHITCRNMKKVKHHWIWKYLDQLSDGHRHYLLNLSRKWRGKRVRFRVNQRITKKHDTTKMVSKPFGKSFLMT